MFTRLDYSSAVEYSMIRRYTTIVYYNRLLWQTVSDAADKSIATQSVRSGGFLWLNPIAMSVVNCSRAEVVECSGLKPCWS